MHNNGEEEILLYFCPSENMAKNARGDGRWLSWESEIQSRVSVCGILNFLSICTKAFSKQLGLGYHADVVGAGEQKEITSSNINPRQNLRLPIPIQPLSLYICLPHNFL